MNTLQEREIREAIEAGEDALYSLKASRECLGSAGFWGLFDLFGGGFFSAMFKHSELDDAERYLQDAKNKLKRFQRELTDVDNVPDLHLKTGDFLTFADFFFDGFIADWLVQSKISEGKRQVDNAIRKVEYILDQLQQYA